MFVFVSSDLGCEVAVPAYGCAASNCGVPVIVPMAKANNCTAVADLINQATSVDRIQCIIFFGTCWGDVPGILRGTFGCDVLTVSFEGNVSGQGRLMSRLMSYSLKPTNVIDAVIDYFTQQNPKTCLYARNIPLAIKVYIDDRCMNVNVEATQRVFSGVLNSPLPSDYVMRYPQLGNTFSKHLALCEGALDLDAAGRRGDDLVEIYRELVLERIARDTYHIMQNGHYCVVTSGSEFVNMTHEELHKQFPDVPLTTVRCLRGYTIAHSLRSWSTEISAAKIAEQYGGGGTASAAGWRQQVY